MPSDIATGYEATLVRGLAVFLASKGIGVWSPDTPTTAEPLITMMEIPAQPDRVITLSLYSSIAEHPGIAVDTIGLQVRTRGRSNRWSDNADIASAIYNLLHDAEGLQIGGFNCPLITRANFAPMGKDSNNRWERSDNYTFYVDLPSTGNRE